jgi:hypothetical protein
MLYLSELAFCWMKGYLRAKFKAVVAATYPVAIRFDVDGALVDLQGFLDTKCEALHDHLEKMSDSYAESPQLSESVSEKILELFSKWAIAIATTMIGHDVLNDQCTFGSSQHLKAEEI